MGNRDARPSLDRPSGGSRDLNRNVGGNLNRNANLNGNANLNRNANINRNVNANVNRNLDRNVNVNRNINRNVSVNNNWNRRVNVNTVNVRPGWARPGWGVARPWNYGWYGGWSTPTWGWWGARAAAWGVGTLATAAIINSAVNNAVNNNTTYIVVPNSNYQLLFGSVQPSGTSTISFAVTDSGSTYELTADCQGGLLSGQEPQSAAEAELLNAACQVAFGNA